MELTYRRCSNCANWSDHKATQGDVVVANCNVTVVYDVARGKLLKITRGSESCGSWEPVEMVNAEAGSGAASLDWV